MSGEAGTPSLIDLNKMLGCKLGELCLCLDVCAKEGGGEGGATLISQYSYCGIHRRGQRTVAQLSSSLSLSLSLSHLLRHVTFAKATQWKAARSECDKATGLVATFCLPSFVLLHLLLPLLLPLLPLTRRDNNTHSLIHRFSHSFASLTSIQSCAFYIIMTKSSASLALSPTPAPFPAPSPLSSVTASVFSVGLFFSFSSGYGFFSFLLFCSSALHTFALINQHFQFMALV